MTRERAVSLDTTMTMRSSRLRPSFAQRALPTLLLSALPFTVHAQPAPGDAARPAAPPESATAPSTEAAPPSDTAPSTSAAPPPDVAPSPDAAPTDALPSETTPTSNALPSAAEAPSAAGASPAADQNGTPNPSKDEGSPAQPQAEPAEAGEESAPANADLPVLEFKTRIIGGWEYEDERPSDEQPGEPETDYGFFLHQARFGIDAKYKKRIRAQLDLEFADGLGSAAARRFVRDAWLDYRFAREFRLRFGHFKRPFSRLELIGAGNLPIRSRGLGNDLIVEDLGYGDRALGMQLWGRVEEPGLEWAVSVSNPPLSGKGADLHARLAYAFIDELELGAGFAHKIAEEPTLDADLIAGDAFNVDLRVETAGLSVVIDAMLAEDLRFATRPSSGSFGGYATYDLFLDKNSALQPVVSAEWTDSDLEFSGSEAVRVVAGVNWLWRGEIFRVMPQVEFIRPLDAGSTTPWNEKDTFYVMLSTQL